MGITGALKRFWGFSGSFRDISAGAKYVITGFIGVFVSFAEFHEVSEGVSGSLIG